jgi:signal transduction histidine kinase
MSGGDLLGASSPTRTDATVSASARFGDGAAPDRASRRADGRSRSGTVAREPRPGLPSSVIHELRTPLTSIHGYAQVLQRTLRDEPRAKNALSILVRESTRMSTMLASLSELAELESGEVTSTPVDLEVRQIVDGVVHETRRRDGAAHPIEIEGSAMARCNPTLLSQALLHVLTNATRYSSPGSPITVTIGRRGPAVEICVHDAGISIDPADAERVYQVFERGGNARQAGVRGLGLGLFLARRALADTGGTIDHVPRPGEGTSFRIVLPGT